MITRLDALIIAFWQLLLVFNVQLLMPIFLNYMPSQKCDGPDFSHAMCYDIRDKCNRCTGKCHNIHDNICHGNEACFLSVRDHDYFHSAAQEFGYFCNPHLQFIRVDTVQYVGALLGTIFGGLMADAYGRRRVLLLAIGLGLPSLLISGEANSAVMFVVFRFLVGVFNGTTLLVGWSYVSELISAKKRTLLRVLSSWPLARLIMTLVCYSLGEWRTVTRTLVLLCFPLLPVLFFLLPESHIWLASKSRHRLYSESIQRINWLAGCAYVKRSDHHFTCKAARVGLKEGLVQIYIQPMLRKRMLLLSCLWFCTFYAVYVLDLNSDGMDAHGLFGAQFAICALLVGARFMMGILELYMSRVSSRRLHLGAQAYAVLSVVMLLILYFNGLNGTTVFMLFWFAATVSIDLCVEVCHLAVNDIPIEVRGAAAGASSTVARIATIASTITTALSFEPILFISIIVIGTMNWLVSYFFLEAKADLKEKAKATKVAPRAIPEIQITAEDVFANVAENGSIRSYGTDFKPFEDSSKEIKDQPEMGKSTESKSDLGFSDLILWTTSASNPNYDPTAAAEEDSGDKQAEMAVCNPLDGSCNIADAIIDAENGAETSANNDLVGSSKERADDQGGEEKEGEDDNMTVIRF